MNKLELKHLAPYLPYGLKCIWSDGNMSEIDPRLDGDVYTEGKITLQLALFSFENITDIRLRPILRPLSDLTKEIDCPEVMGEKIVPIKNLGFDNEYDIYFYTDGCYFVVYRNGVNVICRQGEKIQKLLEWHFDVFGLIDLGLAVDVNLINVD